LRWTGSESQGERGTEEKSKQEEGDGGEEDVRGETAGPAGGGGA